MTPLEQLVALCPPPAVVAVPEPPSGTLGTPLTGLVVPPSHLALNARYGAGEFDEFVVVYALDWSNRYLDLGRRTAESSAALAGRELPALRALLAEYDRRPEELIHWASTHNGDSFFWVPTGEPDAWPTVLVSARQFDQEILTGDSPTVLLGLLSGAIRSHILPDDFPGPDPAFELLR
ncbi:hypothetical protein GCM10009665_48460 [Kitasatospora nipponensis]|uniref:SUKH-4 immunity protein of toxin-antitoxin system n=1 Tax=Kitasatospora nipponensis TaxID=258049 RepID=A0ABN1WJH5_9ACTN